MKELSNNNDINFLPSNIISEKILISDNTIFKEKINDFLVDLESKYNDFISKSFNIQNNWKEFQQNKKNSNVFIMPEQMLIKSPTTILNAPWGTGKTYFIEQIAWYWNDEKISRSIFKNFMVIDVLKFINSPNIVEEISLMVYEALCKFVNINNNKDIKLIFEKIGKIILSIFPYILIIIDTIYDSKFFNYGSIEIFNALKDVASNLKKSKDSSSNQKNETIKLLNEIKDIIEPSIIVFDNIERMGIHSWEIIKSIQQLSIFDNLLFLLPINKNQLSLGNANDSNNKNESLIDKYITLGTYYDLKQNYLGILNKLKFNDQDAELINKILDTEINGYNLSIRLVERALLNNKIKESFKINKYKGLNKIYNIWPSNAINEIIKQDIEKIQEDYERLSNIFYDKKYIDRNLVNYIRSFLINKNNDFYSKDYFELITIEKHTNFINVFQNIIDNFVNWNGSFLRNIEINWLLKWNDYLNDLNILKEHLKKKIDSFNIKIKKNKEIIRKNKKSNPIIEEEIERLKNEQNTLINANNVNGLNSKELERKSEIDLLLKNYEQGLKNNEDLITKSKAENEKLENWIKETNLIINSYLDVFIQEIKNFYNDYEKEWSKLTNDKNKSLIIKLLIKSFNEISKENESYYFNINNVFNDIKTMNLLVDKIKSI